MVWNTSPYVLVETEELVQHGQNFMMKEFLRCTLWSLWWLNLGALLVHTPDNCHLFPQRILHLIFFSIDNFMPMSFLHLFSKRAKYALVFSSFSQVFSTCLRQLSGTPWSLPRLLFPQSLGRGGDPRQLAGEDVCENFEIISTLSLFWAVTRIFLHFLFLCVLV